MRLLLHICCAPCSVNPIEYFKNDYEIDLFFYNPNIHNIDEYNKRLDTVKSYLSQINLPLYINQEYLEDTWPKDNRCEYCYRLRIEKIFEFARENGYSVVSTTLLSSPHQNHELIKKLLDEYSLKYKIPYLYYDLRDKYFDGVRRIKVMGLYSQYYCGCKYSKIERDEQILARKNK